MNLKNFLKQSTFLRKSVHITRSLVGLNFIKTVYFNFKFLQFKEALRFPILMYGKVSLKGNKGKIIFSCKTTYGIVRIGKNTDCFSAQNRCLVYLDGIIEFGGSFLASNGVTITVSKGAKLDIGDIVSLGAGAKIRCQNYIKIGKGTGIVEECQVFDTNFHSTKNIQTSMVINPNSPVIIGEFCWIGNRTTVMKGTILKDNTIVASNSLLNKDYSILFNVPYPVIGGMPARLLGSGVVRIYDIGEEEKILSHYKKHPNVPYVTSYPHSNEQAYRARKQLFELY